MNLLKKHKNILSVFACAAIATSSIAMPAQISHASSGDVQNTEKAPTVEYTLGDFNGDGVINYKDFAELISLSPKTYSYFGTDESFSDYNKRIETYKNVFHLTDSQIKAGDLDGNGYFDASEARIVMCYYLRKCNGYTKELKPENFSEIADTDTNKLPESASKYFSMIFSHADEINNYKTFEYSDTKMGDFNLDGKTDSKDAVKVLEEYANSLAEGKSSIPIEIDISKFNADINNDNVIDSKDAVEILKTYAENMSANK